MEIRNFKVILLGESGVGKTQLAHRFRTNAWSENQTITIGLDFSHREFQTDNGSVRMALWDTAGSERYHAVARSYFRNALAAIVCFDVSEPATMRKAKWWINALLDDLGYCIIYLCGTKTDLLEKNAAVADISQFWQCLVDIYLPHQELHLHLVSSRTGYNVEQLFQDIAKRCAPLIDRNRGVSLGNSLITKPSTGLYTEHCCGSWALF